MSERIRLHPDVQARERKWVSEFVLNHVVETPGSKLSVEEVFDSYCDWLARNDRGPSMLSIDGFGRLFPKHFERKTAAYGEGTRKVVFGVRVIR